MNIRKHLDAFMAKLGYVHAPAKSEQVIATLKIEVDDSQVRAALELIESLATAAGDVESLAEKLAECSERISLHKVVAVAISHAQQTAGDASVAAKDAASAHAGALRM